MKNFAVVLLFLCSACAPLQQAPLVYASKISVGVDISGTSTETPGVSLSVGYKQVDAAYVPVAVAKRCDDPALENCKNDVYKIQLTTGESDVEGNHRSGQDEEAAKNTLKQYGELSRQVALNENIRAGSAEEMATNLKRLSELKAKREAATAAAKRTKDLDEQLTKLDTTLPGYEQNRISLTDQREMAASSVWTAADTSEFDLLEAKTKPIQDKLDNASSNVVRLKQEMEKLNASVSVAEAILGKIKSKDAYSVFGRFEGSNKAKTDGASVVLGKVFSTGVASQNLTRGMAAYYANLGAASCFDSAAKVADKVDLPQLKLLLAECRAIGKGGDVVK
ncbi:hypothetical protein F2P44_32680 [Massilia sp. CCM 8695]|uniref:Uncharacterized protein n=1 Tax=Massilia frigida TaxID=2609281 RepID=A0ABX0NJ11_9BURK|nr:hypothetical protein [Massilia frigida]NHZ83984.1 hypothetical protein [Massilia frigida]